MFLIMTELLSQQLENQPYIAKTPATKSYELMIQKTSEMSAKWGLAICVQTLEIPKQPGR
jgi:hypothetical protein